MRVLFILTVFIFSSVSVFAETDTIYFNKEWKPCALADSALYYRLPIIRLDNNKYQVKDYFLSNNQLQMQGTFTDSTDKIKNGDFIYYYENGHISSAGKYANNKKEGYWISCRESGDTINAGKFKNDLRWGEWKFYYKDTNTIRWVINYKEGRYNGELVEVYKNGSTKRRETHKNGSKISGICYTSSGEDTTYFPHHKVPYFPGGINCLSAYLRTNQAYLDLHAKKIKGIARFQILIDEKGNVIDAIVISGIDPITDEILRTQTVLTMPQLVPGTDEDNLPGKHITSVGIRLN